MSKLWAIIFVLALSAVSARASVILNEADFMSVLQEEFAEQGHDESLELEFFGGQTTYVFDDAEKAKIMISQLKINDEQGRFSAKGEIFADGNLRASTSLTGKFYALGEAWVPAKEIAKGEEITADKLKMVSIRLSRIRDAVIISADKLIGQAAKKTLKAGKPINERDIGPVILIKKGMTVASVYTSKGLQITAQAVALQDGAKGQVIELENTKSHKKISGRVINAEMVEVE